MSSIRKRTWTGPDGRSRQAWQVDYRDQSGKRRARQFDRKKDAETWATNALSEVHRGIHTPESVSVTVSAAAALWIKTVTANGREPTTIAAYEQHVRLHIVPKCGAKKLSQLTAPTVRLMLDAWLTELSRPMAVRVFRTFKAIITDAQERGLVAQNVALAVKVTKAPRQATRASPPSKAELRAILCAAEKSDDLKGRTMVELVIFSGLRASELRGLAWRSVDLKRSTVTVDQRADAEGMIGAPKSPASFRTIPLPKRVSATLREWKLACPGSEHDLVFPSEKGKVLSHAVMAKNHIKPILVAAKVTKAASTDPDEQVAKYTAHIFRHAAASLWIEQRMNAKRVQTLVGHGSIQVTFDTYGHLFEQFERDANDANAIERALFADAT
ncbi:tyrosine-type recombinase/integrase [Altererythrobacter sp. Root672]|uniref:tyrosine-type recombinase/integrase n=1 Tax=Altererythrobacter sp. Root672 TaxID=1736584 RepID=UPI0006FBAA14|nr:site-specific integrase [Altererythrobacter sp. Root672]KRA81219.1 integrase [Altererythrobacter sp. Root672]